MPNWAKQVLDYISKNGLQLPFLREEPEGRPSFTLLVAYFSFVVSLASIIDLHFHPNHVLATGISIVYWVLAMIMYKIRELNRAKIDLKTESVDLEGDGAEHGE